VELNRAYRREHGKSEKFRDLLDHTYNNRHVQTALGLVILACFASSIADMSTSDEYRSPEYLEAIYYAELGFAIFFLCELIFNLTGSIRFGDPRPHTACSTPSEPAPAVPRCARSFPACFPASTLPPPHRPCFPLYAITGYVCRVIRLRRV